MPLEKILDDSILQKTYKQKYPIEFKERVISYARINDIDKMARKLKISKKNIERWLKNGIQRKKGAGRKTMNPEMEREIISWVIERIKEKKIMPRRKDILLKAMGYKNEKFKASKGWCDKFLKRNRKIFEKVLKDISEQNEDIKDKIN